MNRLEPLGVPLAGTHLIEASAGTGKTHTITTLYVRLLLELRLQVDQILVVTYTNAATAELRTRIRRRLLAAYAALADPGRADDEGLAQLARARHRCGDVEGDRRRLIAALHGFDDAAIYTIHGFCQRMLQEHAFESGVSFDVQLVTDQTALRDDVVCDFWVRELYDAPAALISHLRGERIALADLAELAQRVLMHPQLAVLPDSVAVGLAQPLAEWEDARTAAADIWRQHRGQLLEMLRQAPLRRNTHDPDKIETRWFPELDALFAAAEPPRACAAVRKLTPAALQIATRKHHAAPTHGFFTACERLHGAETALAGALGTRVVQLQLDLVAYTRQELRRRKREANIQFFDDLLQRLDEALAAPAGATFATRIRSRFRAALIDEFQDTDPVQFQIFRRIYSGSDSGSDAALFLIGDPKQAIYAFRGADVFAYLAAKRDAGAHTYTIDTNWRAGPTLVQAVNAFFQRARRQFWFRTIPFIPVHAAPGRTDRLGGSAAGAAPLEIVFLRRSEHLNGILKTVAPVARAAAAEIAGLLAAGVEIDGRRLAPGDIAVLCRTNAQAAATQTALRAYHIPCVLQGDSSVFDTDEAAELERVLCAMADPADAAAVKAALATVMLGLDGSTLYALQEDEEQWDEHVRRFQEWHEAWLRDGFEPAFRRMLDSAAVQQRLLCLVDGERRLTNVLHLGELLQTAVRETRHRPLALVEWLGTMRVDAKARATLASESAQLRLESDAGALKLVTIHKSKGLEYPVVFCPFLWDGRLLRENDKRYVQFHDAAHTHRLTLDLGSAQQREHLAASEREALAESLRLLYVALTRAQHRCTVLWGAFNESESSALGYLLHQPTAGNDDDGLIAATRMRIKGLSDDAIRADLDALANGSNGAIAITEYSATPAPLYTPATEDDRPLAAREPQRRIHLGWRLSSFSRLIARDAHLSRPAEEGLDHDEAPDGSVSETAPDAGVSQPTVVLHDFPAGTRPGQLVHELLEHLDFSAIDAGDLRRRVGEILPRYGVEMRWAEPLCRAIAAVLVTPLDHGVQSLCLRDLTLRQRLNELEFTFPVCHVGSTGAAASAAAVTAVTSTALAQIFQRHASTALPTGYVERVGQLGFQALSGYLKGFVDLIFEHAGRWFIVDYKTNRLGPHSSDYAPARLLSAMTDHHYFLQYHLYAVALHRYLALRRRDYDYEQHFGGVYYLFLRGMAPAHPSGCGVFRDRPPRALIAALSALFTPAV